MEQITNNSQDNKMFFNVFPLKNLCSNYKNIYC